MAGNITLDNTYHQGGPGVGADAFRRCTDWSPFETYTQRPDDDDVDYSNTTLRGDNFRFLLLILGPTGSGKTAITEYLKRYATLINNVGVRNGGRWIVDSVSYDHIIQRDPDYRNDFNQIMQQAIRGPADQVLRGQAAHRLDKPARRYHVSEAIYNNQDHVQNLYTAYQRARIGELPPGVRADAQISRDQYISRRRRVGFTSNKTRRKKIIQDSRPRPTAASLQKADQIVYRNLRNKIKEGKNIIFESTGKSLQTPKKIFDKLVTATRTCENYRYIVLAAVNFINPEINRSRIIQRFKAQMRLYIQNPDTALIPRLPNPATDTITANNAVIYQNIRALIALCNPLPNKIGRCPGVGIDLLFIFDQNNHDWTVSEEVRDREHNKIYPIAVIPLSKRSIYITKYTQKYNVRYNKADRHRIEKLFAGNAGPDDSRIVDPISKGASLRRDRPRLGQLLQKKIKQEENKTGRRHIGIGGRKKTIKSNKRKSTKKRRRSRRKKKTRRRRRKH